MTASNSKQVLDLFCGPGGLSLGFQQAGYEIVAGVDHDENAIQTYAENHDTRAIQADLAELPTPKLYDQYAINPYNIDVVTGGPPCQGFSLANIERSLDDDRNNLVFVFAEHVDYVQPEVFLMENVRGLRSIDDGETLDSLLCDFEESGYTVEYKLINAADYGVPQSRERIFIQGVRSGTPEWPEPTHGVHPSNEVYSTGVIDG